jgi:hypothetical protein
MIGRLSMIRMAKESKHVQSEVISRALAFFGPGGLGLDVVEQGECCARFEGGGGYVFIESSDVASGKGCEVTVEGREWESQIRQFLGKI